MKCPNCGRLDRKSRVIDSRPFKHTVRRWRLCSFCGHRWKTFEATEMEFFSDRNRNKKLSWTPGEEVTLVTLYNEGKNKSEIARILGRSRMAVSRKLDKLTASGEYFTILETKVSEK